MLASYNYEVDEFFLLLVQIKRIRRQDKPKIPLPNSSGGKVRLRLFSSYNKLLEQGCI